MWDIQRSVCVDNVGTLLRDSGHKHPSGCRQLAGWPPFLQIFAGIHNDGQTLHLSANQEQQSVPLFLLYLPIYYLPRYCVRFETAGGGVVAHPVSPGLHQAAHTHIPESLRRIGEEGLGTPKIEPNTALLGQANGTAT